MTSTVPPSDAEKRHPTLWLSAKIMLPIIIAVLGFAGMRVMIATAPKAERKTPPRTARLVEAQALTRSDEQAVIAAMGLVQPAREVVLYPQISGTVLTLHPELLPGGVIAEGDLLMTIDPADYEIAARKAESDVASARGDFMLEMGQQAVARKEYEMMGSEQISVEERALMLREPQLARAQARLDSAEAALAMARLNLERTKIRAPFHAIVRERRVDTGAQVSPATPLATLTDAEAYWIIAPVPVAQLPLMPIPASPAETGSLVRVSGRDASASGLARTGRVLRLLNALEPNGRMAQLLIEVEDPLSRRPENAALPPLLLGDFVRLEIVGVSTPNVIRADRRWIRNHDQVWIMNDRDELEIRTVSVLFRGQDHVLLDSGAEAGERVVTSDLGAPVPGMKLTTSRSPEKPTP